MFGEVRKRLPEPRPPTDPELKKLERLIQLTIRAFFDPIDIVVIDELVRRRSKVKDKVLAQLLNLRPKEVQSSLYRMKDNLLVSHETRNEKNQIVTIQESRSNDMYKRARSMSIVHTFWVCQFSSFNVYFIISHI